VDFTIAWLIWLGGFVFIEGLALLNKEKGDTLSEHVWKWFKVKEPKSARRNLRVATLAGFMTWLGVHFVTGS
jgi:hypothetical protein